MLTIVAMDKALIIFVKNPILGKAKTRVAATVGDEKALEIYKELLGYTRCIASKIEAERLLFYTYFVDNEDDWSNEFFQKHLQTEGDLGEKMKHAFEMAFKAGAKKVAIIGSDCGDISPEIINNAYDLLDSNDLVIGPAEDGGYYLMGMSQPCYFVFEDKLWSNPALFKMTVEHIKKEGSSFALLPTLNDIDTYHDYLKWKGE